MVRLLSPGSIAVVGASREPGTIGHEVFRNLLTYGFQGPWVGWGHHRWLIDIAGDRIEFVMKHHVIHGPEANWFPSSFICELSAQVMGVVGLTA